MRFGKVAELSTPLAPGDFHLAARCKGKGSVLVLGDDALLVLDPRRVGRRLRPPACIVLAVPKFVPYAKAARWHEEAGAELVEPEDLDTRVAQVAASPLRKSLSLASWAPAPEILDPMAMRILLAIPRLEDLRPAGLVRALKTKPRRLLRACRARFGTSPRCLLRRYKRQYSTQRRAERATLAEIAIEIGYANDANLLRALDAHGVERPPEELPRPAGGVRNGQPHVRE